jgi:hypothetical protein
MIQPIIFITLLFKNSKGEFDIKEILKNYLGIRVLGELETATYPVLLTRSTYAQGCLPLDHERLVSIRLRQLNTPSPLKRKTLFCHEVESTR